MPETEKTPPGVSVCSAMTKSEYGPSAVYVLPSSFRVAAAAGVTTVSPPIDGAFFLIHSSVSDVWLPTSACQLLEQAFGLPYDISMGLYLVNTSIHAKLQQLKPAIDIKTGVSEFDGATFGITLSTTVATQLYRNRLLPHILWVMAP